MGYFYRDYNNTKIYTEKDFTKYWIGNEYNSIESIVKNTKLTIRDKILYYSLKNLIDTTKYKKKIGSSNYKFIKKTVQVFGNKGLIVDIVFYIGIKNII